MIDQTIIEAVKRFEAIVNSLDCECDIDNGYTCPLHTDRILAGEALKKIGYIEDHDGREVRFSRESIDIVKEIRMRSNADHTRISIYFNYEGDEHHIQIPHNSERYLMVGALKRLANLIADHNN